MSSYRWQLICVEIYPTTFRYITPHNFRVCAWWNIQNFPYFCNKNRPTTIIVLRFFVSLFQISIGQILKHLSRELFIEHISWNFEECICMFVHFLRFMGQLHNGLKNSAIKCCRMILIGCNCMIKYNKSVSHFFFIFRHPLVLYFIRKVLKNVEIETNKCMQHLTFFRIFTSVLDNGY